MTLAEQIYVHLAATTIDAHAVDGAHGAVLIKDLKLFAKEAVTAAVIFEDEMKRRDDVLRKAERSGDVTVADRIPKGEDAIVDQLDRIGDVLKLIRDEMPS